jgi:plasmid stability protein
MEVNMGTLTIRLTDDQHQRLKTLAARRGLSLNKLFEEFGTAALAEFDAETRFAIRAARGNATQGVKLLDRLDSHFGDAASECR